MNSIEKIRLWMEDEDRCVTTQKICHELNLSRRDAAHLLSQLVQQEKKGSKRSYLMTTCHQTQTDNLGVPVTEFRLRSSTSNIIQEETTTLMALAPLSCTESIATAHERDLLEWRERVADGRHSEWTMACGNSKSSNTHKSSEHHDTFAIIPADAIKELKDQPPPHNVNGIDKLSASESIMGQGMNTSSSDSLSKNRHKAFSGKKTVTSAASFFGSKTSSKKTPVGISTDKNDNTVLGTKNEKTKVPEPTRNKENQRQGNQAASSDITSIAETKSGDVSGKKGMASKKSVGNADDFVADEEESDDEVETKQMEKKTRSKAQRKAAVREANQLASKQDDGEEMNPATADEPEEKYRVVGAMDAFATTTAKAPAPPPVSTSSTRQRKRRKKLVEETAMVNGYLRTETKAIWEDVPTDEEEEEHARSQQIAKKKPKSNSKNAQGMKQKSLMGFFAKKK